jgi:hypothetical protein
MKKIERLAYRSVIVIGGLILIGGIIQLMTPDEPKTQRADESSQRERKTSLSQPSVHRVDLQEPGGPSPVQQRGEVELSFQDWLTELQVLNRRESGDTRRPTPDESLREYAEKLASWIGSDPIRFEQVRAFAAGQSDAREWGPALLALMLSSGSDKRRALLEIVATDQNGYKVVAAACAALHDGTNRAGFITLSGSVSFPISTNNDPEIIGTLNARLINSPNKVLKAMAPQLLLYHLDDGSVMNTMLALYTSAVEDDSIRANAAAALVGAVDKDPRVLESAVSTLNLLSAGERTLQHSLSIVAASKSWNPRDFLTAISQDPRYPESVRKTAAASVRRANDR